MNGKKQTKTKWGEDRGPPHIQGWIFVQTFSETIANWWNEHSSCRECEETIHGKTKLLQYGGRSFFSAAPKLWNELPDSVRKCESLDVFKIYRRNSQFPIIDNHVKNKKYGNFFSISSLSGKCAAQKLKKKKKN